MPPKFFITHSWKDIDFTKRLCDDLNANDLAGFFDAYSIKPGDVVSAEISRGLEACDVYVPILSRAALKSAWCEEEIHAAITLGKLPGRNGRPRIIPILVEDCQDEMPILLRSRLYINFAGRYDEALSELLTKGFGLKPKAVPTSSVPTVGSTTLSLSQAWPMVGGGILGLVAVLGFMVWIAGLLATIPTPTRIVPVATQTASPTETTKPTVFSTFTSVPTTIPTVTLTNTPTATPTNTPTATPLPPTPTRVSTNTPAAGEFKYQAPAYESNPTIFKGFDNLPSFHWGSVGPLATDEFYQVEVLSHTEYEELVVCSILVKEPNITLPPQNSAPCVTYPGLKTSYNYGNFWWSINQSYNLRIRVVWQRPDGTKQPISPSVNYFFTWTKD